MERIAPWLCLLPVAICLPALFDPPYWDVLTGAFPQGLWLARNGFDPIALFHEKGYTDGGPRTYPFSLYPWLIGALYGVGLQPKLVFAALHVVSLASAWWTLSIVLRLARRHLEPFAALLVTLVLGFAPLFQSLTAQINLDIVLLAFTASAFEGLCEGRGKRAFLASALALHVKTTGILIAFTSFAVWGLRAWRGRAARAPDGSVDRSAARWALWNAVLCLVGALEVWLQSGAGTASVYVRPFEGFVPFVTDRMWLVPEYGALVVVFALSVPPWFAGRRRGAGLSASVPAFVFLATTLVFFAQYTNVLPRYVLQSAPFLLVWGTVVLARVVSRPNVVRGVLVVALGLVLANRNGAFYYHGYAPWMIPGEKRLLPANDGHVLERSLEYRDDLQLCREIARAAERWSERGSVIVAAWPIAHVLGIPEFGYTDRRLEVAAPVRGLTFDDDAVPYDSLYDGLAKPLRKRTARDVVWALSPSMISGGRLGFWPGDEVLEVVECRGRVAVFVRRPAAE